MKKINIQLPEKKLVGITVRTKNADEADPNTGKIGPTVGNYFGNNLSQKISNRVKPGTTYCAYTEFESDEHGEYTYFVGEEVDSFEQIDPMFVPLVIPSSNYVKFEFGPGAMPMVCINAWQDILQMSNDEMGGKRAFVTDFEIYDERAQDPSSTILDVYIGIE